MNLTFCRQCPRLADFLDQVRVGNPDYFARPVPPFGVTDPRLLIVGLAPGMHGANRTGRPFTGDYAGILLYRTLHRFGFASQPESVSADDALQLTGLPHHQCGEMPAAAEQAGNRRDPPVQSLTCAASWRPCRKARPCWRWAMSRIRRCCWRRG